MICPSIDAGSELSDTVPEEALLLLPEAGLASRLLDPVELDDAALLSAPAEAEPVALLPDASDCRLASSDCTSETSLDVALSRPLPTLALALLLPDAAVVVAGVCGVPALLRRSVISEDGALEAAF